MVMADDRDTLRPPPPCCGSCAAIWDELQTLRQRYEEAVDLFANPPWLHEFTNAALVRVATLDSKVESLSERLAAVESNCVDRHENDPLPVLTVPPQS
jgi:hypothetical protein